MRVVVQRVTKAKLTANGATVSEIANGLMVLCGITHDDTQVDIDYLIGKLLKTKYWGKDGQENWKMSVVEQGF